MIFFLTLVFILGTSVGSFLNVVIDRIPKKGSIMGRSHCDHCQKTLATFDLIPVLSFATLKGRCRYCRKKLSWQYPFVETVCGILFTLSFLILTSTQGLVISSLLYYWFLLSVMIVVAIVDLKFYLIPVSLVLLASLVSLFYNFFFLSPNLFIDHITAAFAAAIFFLIIVLATRGKGMGQGDIFLGFLIGMILGTKAAFAGLFLAFLIGAIISLLLIAIRKKSFGQTVPFGPFLVTGFIISLFWSSLLLEWYLMLY